MIDHMETFKAEAQKILSGAGKMPPYELDLANRVTFAALVAAAQTFADAKAEAARQEDARITAEILNKVRLILMRNDGREYSQRVSQTDEAIERGLAALSRPTARQDTATQREDKAMRKIKPLEGQMLKDEWEFHYKGNTVAFKMMSKINELVQEVNALKAGAKPDPQPTARDGEGA